THVEAALADRPRMVVIETPTNPYLKILDIARIAELAHAHDALVVVDNTFASPYLQQPLTLGADLAVHSTTKYLGGHSDVGGGGGRAARAVASATRVFTLAESLGGVESLLDHPASMTHASLAGSPLQVDEGLLRLSVGIEHVDDLIDDLKQALETAK